MNIKNQSEHTIPAHRLSIVIPVYNEEENIAPQTTQIHDALANYQHPWELIIIDDGSTDDTNNCARSVIQEFGSHVRLINLQRNFGQTAAMQAGFDAARGDVIVTLDGDLQNDAKDIPRIVKRLLDEDLDLVSGWRKSRKDYYLRRLLSNAANLLIRNITKVNLHDYGCTLKAFRAETIKPVRLFGEMHRFIPAWMATQTAPARIKEEVVAHHPRRFGESKYGLSRTFRVLLDLLSVYFFMRYRAKPGHFFGKIGFIFVALGGIALSYLLILKLFFGEDIGTRPLLLIGVLFIVLAVQMITTGVLSELVSRNYYETGDIKSYTIYNKNEVESASTEDWNLPDDIDSA
ncbi:MAG: glycosyltransferase family 2 protein [Gammaproteobacteria bacterium]|nr:glycosyltransferase family 2 protein [Gammaproteobacteria bacterium]